ncbi:MAG: SPASM domain-containing protein [Candidatus Cloacimonetes bacterium]|nr:SPASM domain-containing protein [Candidatus Cloacimonadota bacterium]MDD2543357.1 radical SAM protein [Candidatus Cloacimonadota bacterium]MDD4034580.1 radical SAM protein [Candidatus Cloacimonadota bacterium]
MYKKSRFNLELKHNSRSFIYNAYTGALGEIESEQFDYYSSDLYERLTDIEQWLEMGFLVPRSLNEIKLMKLSFEHNRFRPDLFLTIAPTLLCNCSCNYCFQDKSPHTMTPDIYEAIEEMICQQLMHTQNQLPISWYGGEPFLCLDEIAAFSQKLAAQIGRRRLQYNFVTNGTLIDEALLKRIQCYASIRSFQISLDGPLAYHDEIRVYKNGSGTYQDIIKNLPRLAKYGQIVIRINVDNHNLDTIEELLEDLSQKLPSQMKAIIYFANIQRCNTNVKSAPERYIGPMKFWESRLKLNRLAQRYGIKVENLPTCSMGCTYSAQHAFVIDPQGNCYKCWDFIGNPDYIIGNVRDYGNIYMNPEYLRELSFNPYESQDCPQCNLLPLCKSGCLATMNGDLPDMQERLSCREIQNIFRKCIKAKIKYTEFLIQEEPNENIS